MSGPVSAPSAAPTLFLFGRPLALAGTGSMCQIAQPTPYVAGWAGTLDCTSGAVAVAANFAASGWQIVFSLSLRFGFDAASNRWLPRPVQPTQTSSSVFRIEPVTGFNPGAPGSIRLILGPLSIVEEAFNPSSLLGGADVMLQTGNVSLMPSDQLPLSIWSGGMLGLALEDAGPSVTLQRGFLTATLFAGRDVLFPGGIQTVQFFAIQTASVATTLNNAPTGGELAIMFAPDVGDHFALHVEQMDRTTWPSAANPLQAPIEADQFTIEFGLARDVNVGMTLQSVMLHPAEGATDAGPRLLTHGFADRLNASVPWQVLQPISLHLRPFTQQAPSTFLIADMTEAASVPMRCAADVIHGITNETQFAMPPPAAGPAGLAHGSLICEPGSPVPSNGLCNPTIARNGSAPWLKIDAAPSTVAVAKAGHNYTAGTDPTVVTHQFSPPALGLPALPFEFTDLVDPALTQQLHAVIDLATANPQYGLGPSQFETRMNEGPAPSGSNVGLSTLFGPASGQDAEAGTVAPSLEAYNVAREFGLADVFHIQPDGKPPTYVVLTSDVVNGATVTIPSAFSLNPTEAPDVFGTTTWTQTPAVLGLLKLDPTITLDQIFAAEPALACAVPQVDGPTLLDLINPELRGEGWTGLMLFMLPFDFGTTQIGGLFPTDGSVFLSWLAMTPRKPESSGPGNNSVAGRVYWVSPDNVPPGTANDDSQEVRVLPRKLDIGFFDNAIANFDARVDVVFASTFGLTHDDTVTLELDGSYDRKARQIRLVGNLSEPLEVLPPSASGFGPFKRVELTSAEVVHASDGLNSVRLGGNIVLQPLTFETFSIVPGGTDLSISFDNLDISVPQITSVASWIWCTIGYPNIKIDLTAKHFALGEIDSPFQIQIQSLALGFGSVDWGSLLPITITTPVPDASAAARSFVLGLRLDLMELPELAEIDRLKLDFNLGFVPNGGKWSLSDLRAGLCALGFRGFDVDLMRFLEVSADSVEIKPVPYEDADGSPASSTWVIFNDVEVQILGHTVVDGLTVEIFSAGAERGFICFAPSAGSIPPNGILEIDWVLIGHNVQMRGDPPFWQTLISPTFDDPGDDVANGLNNAVNGNTPLFLPQPGGSPDGAWIFAASFSLFDELLEGKFLFQDRRYYGIAIGGGFLEDLFQSDFAISVAYIKGDSASDDSFAVSMRVPTVVMAGFTFLGGVVSVDASMGGNLLLDIGFPWLTPDGGREWDHTFGAIVAIGQGSGGAYIQKNESAATAQTTGGGKTLTIAGGYALQGGLGASFGAAIVTAWVTAGYYAILEGSVTFDENHKIIDIELVGAIGILVRGAAALDWWIISVTLDIVASAEARGTLDWQASTGHAELQLDFQLYVELGAQACVGGGWFKICRSISIDFEMDFTQRIQIG
jgi:hypothetical protein